MQTVTLLESQLSVNVKEGGGHRETRSLLKGDERSLLSWPIVRKAIEETVTRVIKEQRIDL